METTFHKIIRKTGSKPFSCKCQTCKKQCTTAPCLGLPSDIEKLIDSGYGSRIKETIWASGIMLGIIDYPITMYQAEMQSSGCTFFKDGLCELHDLGLKPTEGKLSHHTVKVISEFNKHLAWSVAKEWVNPDNAEIIQRIKNKLSNVPQTASYPVRKIPAPIPTNIIPNL
jgi:hypothetical protein